MSPPDNPLPVPSPTSLSALVAFVFAAGSSFGGPPAASIQQPTRLFDTWEAEGYGRFSGKLQSLFMHRDYSDIGHATSGTLAATLNYRTPDLGGFHLGAQYIYSGLLFESGCNDIACPAYFLSNDEFSVLNEAYLAFDLGAMGVPDTELKIGRQILNYDFAPAYNIRQKDQSYQAVVLKTAPCEGFSLDFGYFNRFSSWASRSGGPSTWRADFIGVEDRVGVPYDTSGFFFASAVCDGWKPWSFALYDFYGDDMFNVFGAKAAYTWDLGPDAGALTFRTHYANQQDAGRMERDGLGAIDSNILELAVDYSLRGLNLGTGTVLIRGDDFQTPFRTSFSIDTELLWYTMQFEGDTTSGFLKAVYKYDKWLFYALYVISDHEDDSLCQEIDGVVKYSFNDRLSTSFKAGYGDRQFPDRMKRTDTHAVDLRWFVGWTF